MKSKQEYRFGIGVPSMLMLFMILCLTTLAVLSFASSRADDKLTRRTQDMTLWYYEAAQGGQEKLRDLDAALMEMGTQAADAAAYEKLVADYALLQNMEFEEGILTWTEDAGGGRTLRLSVQVAAYGQAGQRYTLTQHTLTGPAHEYDGFY